jgi:hypothetical protein
VEASNVTSGIAEGVRDTVEQKCPEPKIDNEHGLQDAATKATRSPARMFLSFA